MPIISSFFGIYIRMYHNDHPPPHVHAEYQGHERQAELMRNWDRACELLPLERIPGADND
jgi:hypothetical protein